MIWLLAKNTTPFFLDGESVLMIGLPLLLPRSRWSGRIFADAEQTVKPSISVYDGPIVSISPSVLKKKQRSKQTRGHNYSLIYFCVINIQTNSELNFFKPS